MTTPDHPRTTPSPAHDTHRAPRPTRRPHPAGHTTGLTALAGAALVATAFTTAPPAAAAGTTPSTHAGTQAATGRSDAHNSLPTTLGVVSYSTSDLPQQSQDGLDYVAAVHAIVARPQGTVVYWSVGRSQDAGSGTLREIQAYSSPRLVEYASGRLASGLLLDPATHTAWRPYAITGPASSGPAAAATARTSLPQDAQPRQMMTVYAVFPPLPASVKSVDVDVTGRRTMLYGLPVTHDLPTPLVEADTVPYGQGYPDPHLDTIQPPTTADGGTSVNPATLFEVTDVTGSVRQGLTTESGRAGAPGAITLASDVLFATGQATITPTAASTITAAAARIKDSGATSARIDGYTDTTGTASINGPLSQRRAEAVAAAMRAVLPGVSLTATGHGPADPVADNATPQGRAANRRVTITATGAP